MLQYLKFFLCIISLIAGECSGEGCSELHSSSQNQKSGGGGLLLTLEQMLEVRI